MILQARNIFCQIFQSKHINQEIFSSVGMDILLKSTFGYSDVTLYCLSYHLSDITNDGMFLQYFIGKKLNTRWDRIVYKDIDHMRLKQCYLLIYIIVLNENKDKTKSILINNSKNLLFFICQMV